MAEIANTPLPSKYWTNFFNKFNEIDTLKISKWKEVHFLAYLCRRYETLYGRKFAFSFQGAPSKCTEMVMIKRMCAMLCNTNPKIIKAYIDWVFDEKIIPNKSKIKSLGFFTVAGIGNEFLFWYKEQNKIDKSTQLPTEYLNVAQTLDLPVSTYGDLAFAKCALDEAPEAESRAPYRQLLQQLYAIGLDPQLLKELK